MTNLVDELRAIRTKLKSGEYNGADLMRAWCTAENAAAELESLTADNALAIESLARQQAEIQRLRAPVKGLPNPLYLVTWKRGYPEQYLGRLYDNKYTALKVCEVDQVVVELRLQSAADEPRQQVEPSDDHGTPTDGQLLDQLEEAFEKADGGYVCADMALREQLAKVLVRFNRGAPA